MTRRYGILAALLVMAAMLLALAARQPHRAPADASAPAAIPETRLALSWRDGQLDPEHAAVPKGHRVLVTLVNHDAAPLSLTLGGYQDRVHAEVAPGATWNGSFLADLPGDDFAWLAHQRPVGILRVTGSHLEEGHQ
jgi:hypothetical protein